MLLVCKIIITHYYVQKILFNLKGAMSRCWFFMVASPVCENWSSHIWSQYDKLFSRYNEYRHVNKPDCPISVSKKNCVLQKNNIKTRVPPVALFLRRNVLLTYVLLINDFIKRYQSPFIMNFTNKKINHLDMTDNDRPTIS